MIIGIPREIYPRENRVAITPEIAEELKKFGFSLTLEKGAGSNANFSDEAYMEVGVQIIKDTKKLWSESDIILKVRRPIPHPDFGIHEADLMRPGAILISFIWPAQNEQLLKRFAERKVTVLAMDAVPRITRAQKMDALSSMANISGYRAVVEAANQFGRFFTGQITAAGKIQPAKVLVIGAGVAGLAAIGAASGMGAIVRAFDTRPEVKEQVESMGAEFLDLDFEEDGSGEGGYAKVMSPEYIQAEMELFAQQAMEVDIIITTALIPGKEAPKLITAGMIESMRSGSVVVDLAAENGGNCTLTVPGEVVEKHRVTLVGYRNLPSRLPAQSSQLYAANLKHLISDMCKEKNGVLNINMEDDVIRGTTVVKDGTITWPPPKPKIAPKVTEQIKHAATPAKVLDEEIEGKKEKPKRMKVGLMMIAGVMLMAGMGAVAPQSFINHFTVFVLACFVGYQVVWNITPALHTPLMSVTNAISGIIVIGAILQVAGPITSMITILSGVAILISTINIAGGFLVTQRMLKMFRK